MSSDGTDVTSGGRLATSNRKGSVANGGPAGMWLDEAATVAERRARARVRVRAKAAKRLLCADSS